MRYFDALERDDIQTVLEWRESRDVFPHLRTRTLKNSDEQREWWRGLSTPTVEMMAVREKVAFGDDPLVNVVGLTNIDTVNDVAEVSIVFNERTDLLGLVLWGFQVLNLHRLEAECYRQDRCELVESVGFRREGLRREALVKGVQRTDTMRYGLIHGDLAMEADAYLKWLKPTEGPPAAPPPPSS